MIRGLISSLLLTALISSPAAGGDLPADQGQDAAASDQDGTAVENGLQSDESSEDGEESALSGKSVLSDLVDSRLTRASLFPEAGATLRERISAFRAELDIGRDADETS